WTRRCSSGAASVSSTVRTMPVNGETHVRSRGSDSASGVGRTGASSVAGRCKLLVPRQHCREVPEPRAGGAAGHSVDVMQAHAEYLSELDGVERRRGVVASEDEPKIGIAEGGKH